MAAWITQKAFKLAPEEGSLIFGLSTSHAAATLAIILVGYNIIIGETPTGGPIRLLNEDVLNGTILLILVSCGISSFVVEKASQNLALQENAKASTADEEAEEKILISLAYPNTVNDLTDLALLIKPPKSKAPIYALHVRGDQDASGNSQSAGKKMLDNVIKQAAATDQEVVPIIRFDLNISNGIIYTIKEHNITDLIMGMHKLAHAGDAFFGAVTQRILARTPETFFIYKPAQPINTLKRIVVAVPPKAEYEHGFQHWFNRILALARGTGLPLFMYTETTTLKWLRQINESDNSPLNIVFEPFAHWEEFLIFTREVKQDDLFVIVSSRKGHLSYHPETEKLPYYLPKYFSQNSYLILYPEQLDGLATTPLRPLEEIPG
jgi:nucleotide-binding universal stress UspA family protein